MVKTRTRAQTQAQAQAQTHIQTRKTSKSNEDKEKEKEKENDKTTSKKNKTLRQKQDPIHHHTRSIKHYFTPTETTTPAINNNATAKTKPKTNNASNSNNNNRNNSNNNNNHDDDDDTTSIGSKSRRRSKRIGTISSSNKRKKNDDQIHNAIIPIKRSNNPKTATTPSIPTIKLPTNPSPDSTSWTTTNQHYTQPNQLGPCSIDNPSDSSELTPLSLDSEHDVLPVCSGIIPPTNPKGQEPRPPQTTSLPPHPPIDPKPISTPSQSTTKPSKKSLNQIPSFKSSSVDPHPIKTPERSSSRLRPTSSAKIFSSSHFKPTKTPTNYLRSPSVSLCVRIPPSTIMLPDDALRSPINLSSEPPLRPKLTRTPSKHVSSPANLIQPSNLDQDEELDDFDFEHQWAPKTKPQSSINTSSDPTIDHPASTSIPVTTDAGLHSTRRSTRSVPQPNTLIDPIIKLRPIPPVIPDKFSMSHILKEQQKRTKKQEILKQKREELAMFSHERLPDRLITDSLGSDDGVLSPKKRSSLHVDDDDRLPLRSSNGNKKSKTNEFKPLNAITSVHRDQSINNSLCPMDEEGKGSRDLSLMNSSCKLIVSKEDLNGFKDHQCQSNPSKSLSNSDQEAPAGRIQKLLMEDVISNEQEGLNRGVKFRQVFNSRLMDSNLSRTTSTFSTTMNQDTQLPLNFSIDYLSVPGVSDHENVVEFAHELIDNLNYSIKHPERLSLDLVNSIPGELIKPDKDQDDEKMEQGIKTLKITQQTLLRILFRPFMDPKFSLEVVQRSLILIRSILCQFNRNSNSNSNLDKALSSAHQSFWFDLLSSCFVKLGLLNHLVFPPRNPHLPDDHHVHQDPQLDIPFDFTSSIHRIRLVLRLIIVLSSLAYLDGRSRTWAFAIGLRLGLEPRCSDLRMDVVELSRHILGTLRPRSTSLMSIEEEDGSNGEVMNIMETKKRQKDDDQDEMKDQGIRLMVEVLKIGISLVTWTNQLELLRLLPSDLHFRKSVSLAFLDLSACHLDPSNHFALLNDDQILFKMARWFYHISHGFTTPPPAREIYNSIREVSKRPYEKFFEKLQGEQEEDTELDVRMSGDKPEDGESIGEGRQENGEVVGKESVGENEDGESFKEIEEKKQDDKYEGRLNMIKKGRFRMVIRKSLDLLMEDRDSDSEWNLYNFNETQFKALIDCFQLSLIALWDYLVDIQHRDEVKTAGYNPNPPSYSSSMLNPIPKNFKLNNGSLDPSPISSSSSSINSTTTITTTASGNVWIRLIQRSLETLDRSIKHNTSPQRQADRIKLKNSIFRLATSIEFLNQDSFLIIKGIDNKGQFKLDKFFKTKT